MAVVLAACSTSTGTAAPVEGPGNSTAAATTLAAAVARRCAAQGDCGLVPAPPGITDALRLDRSRVTGGQPLTATLTIVNDRGYPVTLPDTGCRPRDTVVLANRQHAPNAAFTSDCQRGAPLTLAPGRTTRSFTVVTVHDRCAEVSGGGGFPKCGPNGGPPPLPPGRYVAVLVGTRMPLPEAISAPVTVTASD